MNRILTATSVTVCAFVAALFVGFVATLLNAAVAGVLL